MINKISSDHKTVYYLGLPNIFHTSLYSVALIFAVLLFHSPLGYTRTPDGIAIATAHPHATDAGVEILNSGGNAFDAAVAITAALAVVEPFGSGLGGGGFWLLHRAKDGKQVVLDGREKAPAAAGKDMYLDRQGEPVKGASINGPKSAAIPGLPAALEHLAENYGNLSLERALEPAIRLAEQGFVVTERYRKLAGFRLSVMRMFPSTVSIFLEGNEIPSLGYRIVQTDLAATLKKLATNGMNYFYNGEMAAMLVEGVVNRGGLWRMEDLAAYKIVERAPIIAHYNDLRIVLTPPPSSGGIVLAQALTMLNQFDLQSLSEIEQKHVIIEILKRAYRDRAFYLGDPDFINIPWQKLLDKDYLTSLATTIDLKRATPSSELGDLPVASQKGMHTTHFSVIDRQGNRVAATLSINLPFGSAFVVPGTGILLNNEMDDFSIKPRTPNAYGLIGDHANAIEAHKRPLSSMSPTFIESNGRVGVLGTPGGSRIISMVLLGILDFAIGGLPSSWVSVDRYHHQYFPDMVQFEQGGLSPLEQGRLRELGHMLEEKGRRYGNMQAILWDKRTNELFAASDPRGEGKALVIME